MRTKPLLIRGLMVDDDGSPIGLRTVRLDDLKEDLEAKRSVLNDDQRRRLYDVYNIVGRYTSKPNETPAHWVETFAADCNPEKEVRVWERIVKAYEKIGGRGGVLLSDRQKKLTLQVILGITMDGVDISECAGTTEAFVDRCRRAYEGVDDDQHWTNIRR